HGQVYNHCFRWQAATSQWVADSSGWTTDLVGSPDFVCDLLDNPSQHDDPSQPDYGGLNSPEETITEWELKDVNGDGYPDFLLDDAPAVVLPDFFQPPSTPGTVDGEARISSWTAGVAEAGDDVWVMMNTGGVHFTTGSELFASPISFFGGMDSCEIEH